MNNSTTPLALMRTRALEEAAEVVGDLCKSATPNPWFEGARFFQRLSSSETFSKHSRSAM